MSQQLISLNPDLQKLQDEGFEIEVRDGLLIVHHIPYLNSKQEIDEGFLAMDLHTNGNQILPPPAHTAYWSGEEPYGIDCQPVPSLINGSNSGWNGLNTKYFLSCRPNANGEKYLDFHEKVNVYFATIAGPAFAKDKRAAQRIRECHTLYQQDSPLQYQDTNASRAGLVALTSLLKEKKVAIVGLGGTGSYLLDFIAKQPVARIDIYDDDMFNSHNAFRSPGAPSSEDLEKGLTKVDYLFGIYNNMHKNIVPHNEKVTDENIEELYEHDAVFICVDSVKVRNFIARKLQDRGVVFYDSGLGLLLENGRLAGQVRVTQFNGKDGDHLKDAFGSDDADDDIYSTNVQISEMNAMAALLMLIQWKKHLGFYASDVPADSVQSSIYNITPNRIIR